jgi:hypothetical protein
MIDVSSLTPLHDYSPSPLFFGGTLSSDTSVGLVNNKWKDEDNMEKNIEKQQQHDIPDMVRAEAERRATIREQTGAFRMTNEEDIEKIEYLIRYAGVNRFAVTFNELCDDGIFRPIFLDPGDIISVKRLITPHQIGAGIAHTSICHREYLSTWEEGKTEETFVFEQIDDVLLALGSMRAVKDHNRTNYYCAEQMLAEHGFKYSLKPKKPSFATDR